MSSLRYTEIDEIPQIRDLLRESFHAGRASTIAYRKKQLLQLAYMFQDNLAPFQAALQQDLGRPAFESSLFDLSTTIAECLYAYRNVDAWVKPEKRARFDANWFLFSPTVYKEAKGTVLIVTPFNFPLFCLAPLAGAIAAGCAAVVKPSELAPATSQLLTELFPKYLDNEMYRIVNGAVAVNTVLLELQWDHILYTGGGRVGRIVATAAAKHLTPVTLELGGKCPVIVDANTDFDMAARRILWGRMMNAGQTCAAPDYVLVMQHVQTKFVDALKRIYPKFYGTDAQASDSFARICSPSHWERISGLLKDTHGEIVLGGQTDRATKYIAPTVVKDVSFRDSLMREEIFGPILPIVPVPDVTAALEYINGHDHPLVLYVFSKDAKFRTYVRKHTLSGQFFENDTLLHGGASFMPFGGVGASGYGSHKGKASFDTFTHLRPGFSSPSWIDLIMGLRYPPYTAKSHQQLKKAFMPPIPYARPGQSEPFNWKRWVVITLAFGLVAANKRRLMDLVGA